MAKFVLMFNKQVIQEFPLNKGSVTIGRNEENDITIENLAVSGFHARVDKTGRDYILTDLQSTNGTFVNDKKIFSHKLSHGDNIIIGKHTLLFLAPELQAEDAEADSGPVDLNKTMMLDTERQRELLAKQEKTSPPPKKPEKIGVLSFLDGSKVGEVELKKKLTRIGKASTSEVRLSGLFMGSTAATISKRPTGYTITFTGGLTKLKVNGEVVKGSIPLKDFDTIELGSYKFQFYQKEVE
ncbi:MAG: FHA domain-containing protein [Deltaproteobacteria bacterium]|nr:MAG: FHA domain-containing protein [Deltaproteobacteria bacterium]